MTKRILLAGLLGGLAMFLWSAIAHVALPLGEAGIRQIDNEKPFLEAMKTTLKDSPGLYMFPAMPAGMSEEQYGKELQANPSGIILYTSPGAQMLSPGQLAFELAVEILESLLLAFLLTQTSLTGFGPRFTFVLVAAVFGTIWTNLSYLNWYNFPLTYTLAYWFTEFVGMILGGLVVIRMTRR